MLKVNPFRHFQSKMFPYDSRLFQDFIVKDPNRWAGLGESLFSSTFFPGSVSVLEKKCLTFQAIEGTPVS